MLEINNTHCTQTLLASNNDDANDNDPDNICLFNFLYWLFLTPETWHIVDLAYTTVIQTLQKQYSEKYIVPKLK